MAKKDLIEYYLKQQGLYLGMLANVRRVDDDMRKGLIDGDERDRLAQSLEAQIEPIKEDYERLAYLVFLLNEPKRKSKKKAYLRQNAKWYSALSGSSREACLRRDSDALSTIKRLIEEAEKGKGAAGDDGK